MSIDLGDPLPDLAVTITDAAGNPANAGSVTLTITLPDSTVATPAVSNPSVGRYEAEYATAQPGRHVARWVATGVNSSAYVDVYDVRSATPGYIVSLGDAKRHLNMSATVTTNDEKLRSFIEAATEVIERHVDQAVVVRSFTEIHPGGWAIALNRTPVLSVATLVPVYTGGTSYLPADVDIDPSSGILRKKDGTGFANALRITYTAGRAIVPPNYTLAAHIIIGHLWQTQRGAGIGSASGLGFEGESDFLTGLGFAIPHRAIELLGPSISGIA